MKKGFAPIIILLVLVGAGAYYFGILKNKQNLVLNTTTPTLAPYPNFTGNPTNPSTANWKTYTNSEWKFSIRYPNIYEVLINKDNGVPYVELRRLGDQMDGTDGFSHSKIFIENSIEQTIDKTITVDQSKYSSQITQTKQIDIAGTQGQSFYVSGFGHQQNIYVFSKYSNKVMSIYVDSPNEDTQRQEQPDIDQILSTFKFIN